MDVLKVRVENGKYTFERVGVLGLGIVGVAIHRYDETWVRPGNIPGTNAILSMMAELDAARVVLEAARKLADAAPPEIREALARHRALVNDDELPSPWTLPSQLTSTR